MEIWFVSESQPELVAAMHQYFSRTRWLLRPNDWVTWPWYCQFTPAGCPPSCLLRSMRVKCQVTRSILRHIDLDFLEKKFEGWKWVVTEARDDREGFHGCDDHHTRETLVGPFAVVPLPSSLRSSPCLDFFCGKDNGVLGLMAKSSLHFASWTQQIPKNFLTLFFFLPWFRILKQISSYKWCIHTQTHLVQFYPGLFLPGEDPCLVKKLIVRPNNFHYRRISQFQQVQHVRNPPHTFFIRFRRSSFDSLIHIQP